MPEQRPGVKAGMGVTVAIPSLWREIVGGAREVRLPAGRLDEVLQGLTERYPRLRQKLFDERGAPHAYVNLFVNQEHVRFQEGLATGLVDGDEVYIVPMITGG